MSSCTPNPSQTRENLPPPPPPSVHFSSTHLPLSHWSSASQSSPGAFLLPPAAHLLSWHEPLLHSPSLSQASPNSLPPSAQALSMHEWLLQSLSASQASPASLPAAAQPSMPGGQSSPGPPPLSPHALGGS